MKRDVDINEISDGKRYQANDMVKISCNDCNGCSECCRTVGNTIILDPFDIFQLTTGLDTTFDELLSGDRPVIELSMEDGLLLPNIKMQDDNAGCIFLNEEGMCSIHNLRPGFCRLFPLGRIYENGSFDYFIQIHECPYPNKSKVKIRKWIGISDLHSYEKFVLCWHDLLERLRGEIAEMSDVSEISRITVAFLELFYKRKYDKARSFYEQIEERLRIL